MYNHPHRSDDTAGGQGGVPGEKGGSNVVPEDGEAVRDLVARLSDWLAAHRPDYHEKLQPGATLQELDEFEVRAGVELPLSFRLLYSWRNGQPPTVYHSLQENWMFSPLADILGTKELLDDMIGTDFEDPNWWKRGWLPFLDNGGGDHLCLDLSPDTNDLPKRIICFWHDDPTRHVNYLDMQAWLKTLVDSMEDGSYEVG